MATPAAAGTITQSDRASVVAALGGGAVVEDFSSDFHFPISTGVLNAATDLVMANGAPITPGMILAGVTYSTPVGSGNFFNIDGLSSFYSGGFLDSLNANTVLTATFDAAQTSFGFDTNKKMGGFFNITINFANGTPYTAKVTVPNSNTLSGFGFTSSGADIISATLTAAPGSGFALDSFTYGPGVPLPEPGSLALLAGFLGAGLLVRRKAG